MIGAGNSNTTVVYEFIDEKPFVGINYYRLKQVDFDGQYSYSKVISIAVANKEYFLGDIAPNPATDIITYSVYALVEETINIEIIDIVGRVVIKVNKELAKGTHVLTANVSDLPKGSYFLKVSNSQQRIYEYKTFVK